MMQGVHASKGSMGNGVPSGDAAARVAADDDEEQRQVEEEEEEEEGEGKSVLVPRGLVRRPWNHHSTAAASRIYRVSRASGGKDRHSKVMTAKGLRDRRVRLSVSTAIQFYDLQDRLGVDQPSKAVEWLIKAAADAITDLPSLDGVFPADDDLAAAAAAVPPPGATHHEEQHKPPPPHPPDDEEDIADVSHQQLHYTNHLGRLQQHQQEQQHHLSLARSTCSSTSETSKGSVLSLSRSEGRVKARERARERAATAKVDKDMEDDDAHIPSATHRQAGVNPLPTTTTQTSFTQLLACGGHHNHAHHTSVAAHANPAPADFVHKQLRHQLPTSTTADYFGQLLGTGQKPHQPTGMFSSQAHFGGSTSPTGMVQQQQQQQQQQHYMQEHLIPFAVTSAAAGGDYINFSISSGFNRGTLQSNSPSPSLHHHLQMFSSPVDGSNLPFFLGTAAQAASASGEAQLPAGFDSRLQLCYGGYRHSDLKGKGKN